MRSEEKDFRRSLHASPDRRPRGLTPTASKLASFARDIRRDTPGFAKIRSRRLRNLGSNVPTFSPSKSQSSPRPSSSPPYVHRLNLQPHSPERFSLMSSASSSDKFDNRESDYSPSLNAEKPNGVPTHTYSPASVTDRKSWLQTNIFSPGMTPEKQPKRPSSDSKRGHRVAKFVGNLEDYAGNSSRTSDPATETSRLDEDLLEENYESSSRPVYTLYGPQGKERAIVGPERYENGSNIHRDKKRSQEFQKLQDELPQRPKLVDEENQMDGQPQTKPTTHRPTPSNLYELVFHVDDAGWMTPNPKKPFTSSSQTYSIAPGDSFKTGEVFTPSRVFMLENQSSRAQQAQTGQKAKPEWLGPRQKPRNGHVAKSTVAQVPSALRAKRKQKRAHSAPVRKVHVKPAGYAEIHMRRQGKALEAGTVEVGLDQRSGSASRFQESKLTSDISVQAHLCEEEWEKFDTSMAPRVRTFQTKCLLRHAHRSIRAWQLAMLSSDKLLEASLIERRSPSARALQQHSSEPGADCDNHAMNAPSQDSEVSRVNRPETVFREIPSKTLPPEIPTPPSFLGRMGISKTKTDHSSIHKNHAAGSEFEGWNSSPATVLKNGSDNANHAGAANIKISETKLDKESGALFDSNDVQNLSSDSRLAVEEHAISQEQDFGAAKIGISLDHIASASSISPSRMSSVDLSDGLPPPPSFTSQSLHADDRNSEERSLMLSQSQGHSPTHHNNDPGRILDEDLQQEDRMANSGHSPIVINRYANESSKGHSGKNGTLAEETFQTSVMRQIGDRMLKNSFDCWLERAHRAVRARSCAASIHLSVLSVAFSAWKARKIISQIRFQEQGSRSWPVDSLSQAVGVGLQSALQSRTCWLLSLIWLKVTAQSVAKSLPAAFTLWHLPWPPEISSKVVKQASKSFLVSNACSRIVQSLVAIQGHKFDTWKSQCLGFWKVQFLNGTLIDAAHTNNGIEKYLREAIKDVELRLSTEEQSHSQICGNLAGKCKLQENASMREVFVASLSRELFSLALEEIVAGIAAFRSLKSNMTLWSKAAECRKQSALTHESSHEESISVSFASPSAGGVLPVPRVLDFMARRKNKRTARLVLHAWLEISGKAINKLSTSSFTPPLHYNFSLEESSYHRAANTSIHVSTPDVSRQNESRELRTKTRDKLGAAGILLHHLRLLSQGWIAFWLIYHKSRLSRLAIQPEGTCLGNVLRHTFLPQVAFNLEQFVHQCLANSHEAQSSNILFQRLVRRVSEEKKLLSSTGPIQSSSFHAAFFDSLWLPSEQYLPRTLFTLDSLEVRTLLSILSQKSVNVFQSTSQKPTEHPDFSSNKEIGALDWGLDITPELLLSNPWKISELVPQCVRAILSQNNSSTLPKAITPRMLQRLNTIRCVFQRHTLVALHRKARFHSFQRLALLEMFKQISRVRVGRVWLTVLLCLSLERNLDHLINNFSGVVQETVLSGAEDLAEKAAISGAKHEISQNDVANDSREDISKILDGMAETSLALVRSSGQSSLQHLAMPSRGYSDDKFARRWLFFRVWKSMTDGNYIRKHTSMAANNLKSIAVTGGLHTSLNSSLHDASAGAQVSSIQKAEVMAAAGESFTSENSRQEFVRKDLPNIENGRQLRSPSAERSEDGGIIRQNGLPESPNSMENINSNADVFKGDELQAASASMEQKSIENGIEFGTHAASYVFSTLVALKSIGSIQSFHRANSSSHKHQQPKLQGSPFDSQERDLVIRKVLPYCPIGCIAAEKFAGEMSSIATLTVFFGKWSLRTHPHRHEGNHITLLNLAKPESIEMSMIVDKKATGTSNPHSFLNSDDKQGSFAGISEIGDSFRAPSFSSSPNVFSASVSETKGMDNSLISATNLSKKLRDIEVSNSHSYNSTSFPAPPSNDWSGSLSSPGTQLDKRSSTFPLESSDNLQSEEQFFSTDGLASSVLTTTSEAMHCSIEDISPPPSELSLTGIVNSSLTTQRDISTLSTSDNGSTVFDSPAPPPLPIQRTREEMNEKPYETRPKSSLLQYRESTHMQNETLEMGPGLTRQELDINPLPGFSADKPSNQHLLVQNTHILETEQKQQHIPPKVTANHQLLSHGFSSPFSQEAVRTVAGRIGKEIDMRHRAAVNNLKHKRASYPNYKTWHSLSSTTFTYDKDNLQPASRHSLSSVGPVTVTKAALTIPTPPITPSESHIQYPSQIRSQQQVSRGMPIGSMDSPIPAPIFTPSGSQMQFSRHIHSKQQTSGEKPDGLIMESSNPVTPSSPLYVPPAPKIQEHSRKHLNSRTKKRDVKGSVVAYRKAAADDSSADGKMVSSTVHPGATLNQGNQNEPSSQMVSPKTETGDEVEAIQGKEVKRQESQSQKVSRFRSEFFPGWAAK